MRNRVLIPELMDDPELDPKEHIRALQGLRRINSWTRNAALMWRQLSDLAGSAASRRLRILDVATGSADIPIRLWHYAEAAGIKLDIDACDVSDRALEFAAQNCDHARAKVRLFPHDILQRDIESPYDVVICSQFLHHLTDTQTAQVLATMARAAAQRVVVVDLVRSRLNWLQVSLATRVLSRSKIVHFDGPQSIRAAFTVRELSELAAQCNFQSVTLRSHWPCRMTMVGVVGDHD